MSKKLQRIGFLITFFYVFAILLMTWNRLPSLWNYQTEINAVGDFLAGAFAPLAFLWLVIGYFQQGEELRQSRTALELQAEELRHSVEQQQAMVAIAGRQLQAELDGFLYERERRNNEKRPRFKFFGFVSSRSESTITVELELENYGGPAEDIAVLCRGQKVGSRHLLLAGDKLKSKLGLAYEEHVYVLSVEHRGEQGTLIEYFELSIMISDFGTKAAEVKISARR